MHYSRNAHSNKPVFSERVRQRVEPLKRLLDPRQCHFIPRCRAVLLLIFSFDFLICMKCSKKSKNQNEFGQLSANRHRWPTNQRDCVRRQNDQSSVWLIPFNPGNKCRSLYRRDLILRRTCIYCAIVRFHNQIQDHRRRLKRPSFGGAYAMPKDLCLSLLKSPKQHRWAPPSYPPRSNVIFEQEREYRGVSLVVHKWLWSWNIWCELAVLNISKNQDTQFITHVFAKNESFQFRQLETWWQSGFFRTFCIFLCCRNIRPCCVSICCFEKCFKNLCKSIKAFPASRMTRQISKTQC